MFRDRNYIYVILLEVLKLEEKTVFVSVTRTGFNHNRTKDTIPYSSKFQQTCRPCGVQLKNYLLTSVSDVGSACSISENVVSLFLPSLILDSHA